MTQQIEEHSTWTSKFKALGPGILMASARWFTHRSIYSSGSYLWLATCYHHYLSKPFQISFLPFRCAIYA